MRTITAAGRRAPPETKRGLLRNEVKVVERVGPHLEHDYHSDEAQSQEVFGKTFPGGKVSSHRAGSSRRLVSGCKVRTIPCYAHL